MDENEHTKLDSIINQIKEFNNLKINDILAQIKATREVHINKLHESLEQECNYVIQIESLRRYFSSVEGTTRFPPKRMFEKFLVKFYAKRRTIIRIITR